MQRVLIGLGMMASGFAALIYWLELGTNPVRSALLVGAGVLLLGYPVLFLCCKRGWWTPFHTVSLGLLAGILVALPFDNGKILLQFLLLITLTTGGFLGLLFWVVAILGNENLTCPKSFCLPCGTVYRFARSTRFARTALQFPPRNTTAPRANNKP